LAPLDETFQRQAQRANAGREGVLVEMAGLRRRKALPIEWVLPSQIEVFSQVICAKFEDLSSAFTKKYLTALADEIRTLAILIGFQFTLSPSNSLCVNVIAMGKRAHAPQRKSWLSQSFALR